MSDNDPVTVWAPTSIRQTTRERLADLLRAAAVDYLREHPTSGWLSVPWRDKPWHDGILVDLDESDVATHMADFIISRADPERSS